MNAPEEVQLWLRDRLFDSVPVSIAVIDRDYCVVMANRSFEELFGNWYQKQCWEVFKRRERRCSNCPAEAAFREGIPQVRREVGRDREGNEAHYLVQVAPIRKRHDGKVPYCIEMCTDITDMHRLEQEKVEAERLAAVGQTVAGLAHGIKNIITGLEGGMYVMRSGLDKGRQDRVNSGWEMLERNVDRISVMTRNLLGFSKGHIPEVRVVHPQVILDDILQLYRDSASQVGVELVARCGPEVAEAALDVNEIHGCLANLVSNAIDACQMSSNESGTVTVGAREQDGSLILEVTDNGIGMDVEVKRKIFTTFFTTKGSSGTGLGLLLIRKVVQEHGGSVTVDSEPNKGSMFRITLPRDRLPPPVEIADNA